MGFVYKNDPFIPWEDIESIELDGMKAFTGFENKKIGIRLILKNNKTIILNNNTYTNLDDAKRFILTEIIIKKGMFPEVGAQYRNKTDEQPENKKVQPSVYDEWIYFENKDNFLSTIIICAFYSLFISVALISFIGKALPLPVTDILGISLGIILGVGIVVRGNFYNICDHFAIYKDNFYVQNYFSYKKYNFLNKEYIYSFDEIQEVVFAKVGNGKGRQNVIKIVLNDYTNKLFNSYGLKKETSWAIANALEARGVKVRNENPALMGRTTAERVELKRLQNRTLIEKFKALPIAGKIVIIWLASGLVIMPFLPKKSWEPVKDINVCAYNIPFKNIFLDIIADPEANKAVHAIGDSFGGGIVAYILQPGDTGYDKNAKHGLIIAPLEKSGYIEFGRVYRKICVPDTEMGSGRNNTDSIIAAVGTGNSAALVCKSLEIGGYKDWFLPSKRELDMIISNRKLINSKNSVTGLYKEEYWSSTVYTTVRDSLSDDYYQWVYSRRTDSINGGKFNVINGRRDTKRCRVRAVRAY